MFKIQASNPRIIKEFDREANNISDAIESSFSLNSEYAVIIWNYVPVLLSYKYDISIIIDDILMMLNKIRCEKEGVMRIRWPSNTFACTWQIEWRDNNITIYTEWESVIGDTEYLLNARKELVVDSVLFLAEWKKILFNIIQALEGCGYSRKTLKGFPALVNEFEAIKDYGILYEQ